MIGTTEIVVIAVVVLILFGSAAIPRFARAVGRARREFDEGLREGSRAAPAQAADAAPPPLPEVEEPPPREPVAKTRGATRARTSQGAARKRGAAPKAGGRPAARKPRGRAPGKGPSPSRRTSSSRRRGAKA